MQKDSDLTLKLYDATGRLVKIVETFAGEGLQSIALDIANCSAGIYQLQLLQGR